MNTTFVERSGSCKHSSTRAHALDNYQLSRRLPGKTLLGDLTRLEQPFNFSGKKAVTGVIDAVVIAKI